MTAATRWKTTATAVVCLLMFLQGAFGDEPPPLLLAAAFRTVASATPQMTRLYLLPDAERDKTAPPAPVVDGALDDTCWQKAPVIVLRSDMPEGDLSRATRARICCDAQTLYVAFECRETNLGAYPFVPAAPDTPTPENVRFYVQPGESASDFFVFSTDPNGVVGDWSLREGASWSPAWTVKVRRSAEVWTAEMAIPLSVVGAGRLSDGTLWRVNFTRDIASTLEEGAWQPTFGRRDNPALWGLLFVGSEAAFARRPKPVQLRAWSERGAVAEADATLRGTVAIDPGDLALDTCALRIAVHAAGPSGSPSERMADAMLEEIRGNRADLMFNTTRFPKGPGVVSVELIAADGKPRASASFPVSRSLPSLATAETQRLRVTLAPAPVKPSVAAAWPITTGVALPPGAILCEENARLLGPDGAPTPLQTAVRSRWPDGSIQWLGLDFRANVAAAAPQTFTLEYGPRVQRPPFTGFVRKLSDLPHTVVHEMWVVDTGSLLFNINGVRFAGVEEAWVDVDKNGRYDWSEQVLNGSRAPYGPYVKDADGNLYRLSRDKGLRLELEEWNDLRLVFRGEAPLVLTERAEGVGRTPPATLGRWGVRVTAYAGQTLLRVEHTFVPAPQAAGIVLADVGVEENLDLGRSYTAAFGVEGGFRKTIRDSGAELMWLGSDQAVLLDGTQAVPVRPGNPPQNWSCATAADRGVAICLRNMPRLFPKSCEFTAESRLITHFWPPHGDESVRSTMPEANRRTVAGLPFLHHGRQLSFRVPAHFSTDLRDRHGMVDFDAARLMPQSAATGIAPRYELLYYFFPGAFDPETVAQVMRLYEWTPHAVQDAESLRRAGVLDAPLTPAQAARALAMSRRLLRRETLVARDGEFNYGDLRRAWLADEQRWRLSDHWMGAVGDLPGAIWSLYLQTGDADLGALARDNLRHVLAMDQCHDASDEQTRAAVPLLRKIAGGFGDMRTPLHWQSAWHVNDRYARLRSALLAYCLTGDAGAACAARRWAAAARTYGFPSAGEDGAAFLDNLSALLAFEYDPVLLERREDCVRFFLSRSLNPAGIGFWGPGIRRCCREAGASWGLTSFDLAGADIVAARSPLAAVSLLRDLHPAPDQEAPVRERIAALLEQFEKTADAALAGDALDSLPFTWSDFAEYVFAAGDPVSSHAP